LQCTSTNQRGGVSIQAAIAGWSIGRRGRSNLMLARARRIGGALTWSGLLAFSVISSGHSIGAQGDGFEMSFLKLSELP
jgi:hypothetical protein